MLNDAQELAGSLKIHAGEERISKDDVGMMAEPWYVHSVALVWSVVLR